jgi:hypothetical protein
MHAFLILALGRGKWSSSLSGRLSPAVAGNSHCALLTVAWMGSRGDLKMVVVEKFLQLRGWVWSLTN